MLVILVLALVVQGLILLFVATAPYLNKRVFDLSSISNLNSGDVTTSWHPRVSPFLLLVFRAAYLIFSVAVLVICFHNGSPSLLVYFTVWNHLLQTFYFFLIVFATLTSKSRVSPANHLEKFLLVLSGVNTTSVILVAIVLWGLLLPVAYINKSDAVHEILNFVSFAQHGINAPVLLIEFYFNRFFIQRSHVIFTLGWSATYATFALIFRSVGGFDPYFFTNTDHWSSLGVMAGTCVIYMVIFSLVVMLSNHKKKRAAAVSEGSEVYHALDATTDRPRL